MIRAGVFIGVDKTGNLQRLNDAADGAKRMHQWALAQGMADKSHAKLITDTGGAKVDSDLIYDAIKEIIDGAGVDQLIVYFAGHGVNINRTEQWLLTDAPVRTSAAVNVSGSVELARYSGIRHVVFISDACRVAPDSIQAQNVRGVDVFPNDAASEKSRPVDQFFACLLGKTAAEIKDPTTAAANYSALYTSALLDALKGVRPEVLEAAAAAGDRGYYVNPEKLEKYLEAEIPRRVIKMKLEKKVNQNPDAVLTVGGLWLAHIEGPVELREREPVRAVVYSPSHPGNLPYAVKSLVRSAVEGSQREVDRSLEDLRAPRVPWADHFAKTVERVAAPFGPDHFETQCGIKVRGAHVIDFYAPRADGEILGSQGELVRIKGLENPLTHRMEPLAGPNESPIKAASILLRFAGNLCAVIPVIQGFLAALTFEDGELVDVTYEPSASVNNWRWDLFKQRAKEVRALRAVAASASQHGRFRLTDENAIKVAQQMQYAKGIDPTLSIYAAYAYHDLQALDRIRDMSGYLHDDVGATFFDLALLGRMLIGKSIVPQDGVVPFLPLLSQGWALLEANRVKLHPALKGIERTMRDSLWSLFDHSAFEKIKQAMQTREVL